MERQSRIGVGVMIFRNGKVLMGKCRGSHGEGEYAFPGGHLEYMESFEECARRETLEECGIEVENIRFLLLANVRKYSPKHYVHITVIADWKNGELKLLEPEKCESWDWYNLNDLPEPMFEFCTLSFESFKNGRVYYDNI